MQTNLSSYVAQLEAQDNNTILGPFHQRLDTTQGKMETLIEFVSDKCNHCLQALLKQVINSKIISRAENRVFPYKVGNAANIGLSREEQNKSAKKMYPVGIEARTS